MKKIEAVREQFGKIALTVSKPDRRGKIELKPVFKPKAISGITTGVNRETVEAYHTFCVNEYKSREIAAVVTAYAGADLVKLYKKGKPLSGGDTEGVKIATTKLSPIIEDIKLVIMGINAAAMVDIKRQRDNITSSITDSSVPLSDKKLTTKAKRKSKKSTSTTIMVVGDEKKKKASKSDLVSKDDKIGTLFLEAVLRAQQLSTARGLSKQVLTIKSIREIHAVFQKMEGQESIADAVDDDQLRRNRVLEIIHFAQVVNKVAIKVLAKRDEMLQGDQLMAVLTHIQGLKDDKLKVLLPIQTAVTDVTETTASSTSSS